MPENYDAIVIGGGPAGSATATVLAQKGRRALVLERERFPRYHVGESLIPYTYYPLERLGMIDKMKRSHFPSKQSVQFVSRSGKLSAPFYFFDHMRNDAACTWQVARGEFDQMLLDNAREQGVEALQRTRVSSLIEEGGRTVGVKAVSADGAETEYRAPVTVDATGRDSFAMMRKGWRVRDPQLNKIAIWTYYKGAMRDPGRDEGATTVAAIPERGWFWYIPLPDDVVSVGVVAEASYLYRDTRDLKEIFLREVEENSWVKEHLAPGCPMEPPRVTAEFSYRSRYSAADGLVLVGDAFGFLDPVFSSGLFLALRSGVLAGDAIDQALEAGDVSAARFEDYSRQMRESIEIMRRLVYAFYDDGFSFAKLLNKRPDLGPAVTDCLIGRTDRDYDPLFEAVARLADVPPPLEYGGPLVAAG